MSIKNNLFFLLTTLLIAVCHADDQGGFGLGATRVIYLSDKNNATVPVYNTAKNKPLLIQSWISDSAGKTAKEFIVTPPLYRQDNGINMIRIVHVGQTLPNDRESMFFLNVKAIAASPTPFKANDKNSSFSSRLNFSFSNQIKLIYRPAALQSIVDDAYKKVIVSKVNNEVIINNPTAIYINLHDVLINGQSLMKQNKDKSIVAPFSQVALNLYGHEGKAISFTVINDFGGISPALTKALN